MPHRQVVSGLHLLAGPEPATAGLESAVAEFDDAQMYAQIAALTPREKPYHRSIGRDVNAWVLPSGKVVWRWHFTQPGTRKPDTFGLGPFGRGPDELTPAAAFRRLETPRQLVADARTVRCRQRRPCAAWHPACADQTRRRGARQ